MTEINLKQGEPVERAIRRLKKKAGREQTLRKLRERRRRFEKTQRQAPAEAESGTLRRDAESAARRRLSCSRPATARRAKKKPRFLLNCITSGMNAIPVRLFPQCGIEVLLSYATAGSNVCSPPGPVSPQSATVIRLFLRDAMRQPA
jgi:ribosomal protein S21